MSQCSILILSIFMILILKFMDYGGISNPLAIVLLVMIITNTIINVAIVKRILNMQSDLDYIKGLNSCRNRKITDYIN